MTEQTTSDIDADITEITESTDSTEGAQSTESTGSTESTAGAEASEAVGTPDLPSAAPAAAEATAESDVEVATPGAGPDEALPTEGQLEEAPESAAGDAEVASSAADRLENEGDIAADYLEELLDIADLDGDLDMDVEGDRAAVSIVGGDVRQLVGQNGEVLEALQELTRLAVYRETGERSRLMLDIGGFRADKRSRLEKVAAEAVNDVKGSGEQKSLDPMTPFERKVVHDVVAAAGLSSASEGTEPRRYVVVLPA